MNIYLDIDGVLIHKDGRPVLYVKEFLEYVTKNHNVFWLTTHCKGGAETANRYLENYLPKELMQYLENIKPTNWDMLKTEAIDFTKDFRWFDDYIMQAEKMVLKKKNCLDKFISLDLETNPEQLKEIIDDRL